MTRVGRGFVMIVVVLWSCSGGAGGDSEGDSAGATEELGAAPSNVEEAVEQYVGHLEALVEIASGVTDEDSAREGAAAFERRIEALNQAGKVMEDVNPVELGMRMREDYQRIARLSAELGREMSRIAADPELSTIMGNAMREYRAQ